MNNINICTVEQEALLAKHYPHVVYTLSGERRANLVVMSDHATLYAYETWFDAKLLVVHGVVPLTDKPIDQESVNEFFHNEAATFGCVHYGYASGCCVTLLDDLPLPGTAYLEPIVGDH